MTDSWKDFKTAPRNSSVFIAKDKNGDEFECQYATTPDSLGWYEFLKLPERTVVKENNLRFWKNDF